MSHINRTYSKLQPTLISHSLGVPGYDAATDDKHDPATEGPEVQVIKRVRHSAISEPLAPTFTLTHLAITSGGVFAIGFLLGLAVAVMLMGHS